jgi:hypothetical protein
MYLAARAGVLALPSANWADDTTAKQNRQGKIRLRIMVGIFLIAARKLFLAPAENKTNAGR